MLFTADEGRRRLLGVFPSVGHPRLVCPSWGSGTEWRAVNSAAVLSLLSKKLGSKRQINLPSLLPALPRGTFREGGAGLCASDGRQVNESGLRLPFRGAWRRWMCPFSELPCDRDRPF